MRLFPLFAAVATAWLALAATPAQARCTLGSTFAPAGSTPSGVHVPTGWDGATPAPLIVLLHGSTATGAAMLRDSGLAATADRHGVLVAYPDGGIAAKTGFVWNIPGVPTVEGTIPGPGERDDVAYLTALVDGLVAAGCADRTRVYVTGLSGGGRMTSWLGCVAPERFAAIAPVVGLRAGNPLKRDPTRPDPRSCRPKTPVSVIAFAGDADRTNPIQGGGAPYWSYPMHAAEQRWAQLNRCRAAPVTRFVSARVYEEHYGACRDGAEMTARITVGGGHSWVVDNEALWALLSRHRRG
ncbi:prolyl oligopeptidase family serine peptidase [Sphingomonas sp. RP10(2022)]|uniref:Prolyl oligopeptidase family serine peptidase n=1 Tax=Sphingomonas liriopis TaxID=2949094 RepID=A0A9X2KR03_9SPHN|nr:PHB depolymerase family esterase [Sphingomonas liriopis]MCP3735505.1 prolyl oligopeptidase family serine peptidase [Sphingomonas liriopis]